MAYRLFIDDLRFPTTDDWVIARSSAEAIQVVKSIGLPVEIAFDHDLGVELGQKIDVRPFLVWLRDYMHYTNLRFPYGFRYSVHSQNPVGAKWIKDEMNEQLLRCGIVTRGLYEYP